ncbi:hypothetical protein NJB1728e22_36670, partial [Mycobacterium marinum]
GWVRSAAVGYSVVDDSAFDVGGGYDGGCV